MCKYDDTFRDIYTKWQLQFKVERKLVRSQLTNLRMFDQFNDLISSNTIDYGLTDEEMTAAFCNELFLITHRRFRY